MSKIPYVTPPKVTDKRFDDYVLHLDSAVRNVPLPVGAVETLTSVKNTLNALITALREQGIGK